MDGEPQMPSWDLGTNGGSSRARQGQQPAPACSVVGCTADLSQSKEYHRRHKVCEAHSKAPVVAVSDQRFCQQCSRFHMLREFDEGKRSCRKRLADHYRRLKPQPDPSSCFRFSDLRGFVAQTPTPATVRPPDLVISVPEDRLQGTHSLPAAMEEQTMTHANPPMERPYDELEKKLQDPNATPVSFPLEFLKAITCDFSTESILGEGGFGAVYKGALTCGKIIAVKKLFEVRLNEETFQNEVCYHMGIKHPNVVRFLGCCAESSWHLIELPNGSGKYILAEAPKRFLCFEYVCNKSLNKHISDESLGLEWNMRYEIIKGICNGLHFLHEECRMVHLDLKPENILMDSTMMPKIADFGLSRIFGERQSQTVTNNKVGTRGYMAPEYLNRGVVSYKADIFSLGVIVIEIITGGRDYPYFQQDIPHYADPSFQQFTEKVLGSWRNKFGSTPKYKSVEKYIQQVKKCVTIALKCVDPGMEKRPTVKYIIEVLNAADQIGPSPALSKAEVPFWSAQSTTSAKPSSTTPASVPIRYKAASSQGDPYGASQEDNCSS